MHKATRFYRLNRAKHTMPPTLHTDAHHTQTPPTPHTPHTDTQTPYTHHTQTHTETHRIYLANIQSCTDIHTQTHTDT